MLADLFADKEVKRRCVYIKTSGETGAKIISRVEKNQELYKVRARRAPPQGGLELAIDFEAADGDVDARLAELLAGAPISLVPSCGGVELAAEADGADRDALALAHDCAVPLLPAFALDDATARPSRPLEALVRDLGFGALRGALAPPRLELVRDYALARVADVRRRLAALPPGTPARFSTVMRRAAGRYDVALPHDDDEVLARLLPDSAAPWLGAVRALLGDRARRVKAGVVFSLPGAPAQPWHADGQHPLAADGAWPEAWPERPNALCAFLPLVDLDDATGYTTFWPGSHRVPQRESLAHDLPTATPWATVPGKLAAGDALLYDYSVVHRGEANATEHTLRGIVYLIYANEGFVDSGNFAEATLPA